MAERDGHAIEQGRRQAEYTLEARRRRRAIRRDAAVRLATSRRRAAMPQPELRAMSALRAELGPPGACWLLAEGDSWFDYPFHDVLNELEEHHGYEIESVSHMGDAVEAMAYDCGQLAEFSRALEKLIRNDKVPEAILLSGGGNDVAGDAFAFLMNHASSPSPGLNEQVVAGLVDDRICHAYITMLSAMSEICRSDLGVAIPILVHGYDYAVPDGRGFWSGWGPLPGPWLRPGLLKKGYADLTAGTAIVAALIDRFNGMLARIPAVQGLDHVRHVDLRGTLSRSPADYRDWWSNELHPTESGFEAVAQRFAALLA